ncbi:MAG: hypothetical protein NTW13_05970 [Candidatus Omnitrophica bacterium]|nr:hypothetical protein [Candidatus Omnitrophota bacterium]
MPRFIFLVIYILFATSSLYAKEAKTAVTKGRSQEFTLLDKQEEMAVKEEVLRPKVQYLAEGLRDPFKSPIVKDTSYKSSEVKALPQLNIQGLIWGGTFPQAVINNKVVKIGDTVVEGARITDISKEGVTVLYNGMTYQLSSPAAVTAGAEGNPKK